MASASRMSADERKEAILKAAKPLFAEKGFKGTSVRNIAKAANVSEALLYRHFPSKEALYQVILNYSVDLSNEAINEIKTRNPGAETLIHLVYLLYFTILYEVPGKGDEQILHERLLFYSLLEDGRYARLVFKRMFSALEDVIAKNYSAGVEQGEIVRATGSLTNRFWFAHHLAMGLNLCHLAGESAFQYDGTKKDMVVDAVNFALRGIGITNEVIEKYLKSDNLKLALSRIMKE
jgi:TetR/AcrR family transcriptional regulator, transcriptional repressor of aconitase